MKYQVSTGLVLLVVSTFSYYVPVQMAGLRGYDLSQVPERFYSYYCWTSSGSMFLIAFYSLYLLIVTDSKYYKAKAIFIYMFVMETYSFVNHVVDKFFLVQAYDGAEIIFTLLGFTVSIAWVLRAVFHAYKSDPFFPGRSYIIRFKPVNIFGIFNHIINLHGHTGIYQNKTLYKFKKRSSKVEGSPATPSAMESLIKRGRISLKEIPYNNKIHELVGKRYNLFKFNCNHLIKSAEKA